MPHLRHRSCGLYRTGTIVRCIDRDLRRSPLGLVRWREWLWDGSGWRRTGPRFTVGRLPEASVEAWINRVVLAIQGSGIGCAGLMLAMIAFIAMVGGALLTGLAVFGAAAVAILIAAGFGLLAMKQRRARDRWRIALLLVQVALCAIGIPLLNAAIYASDHAGTPQN